jgi:chondroitin sulfate synthase
MSLAAGLAPSLSKFKPKNVTDVIPWEFFTNGLYSDKNSNPRRRMETPLREGLDDVVREVRNFY